jgi:hypothetical protein
MTLYITTPAYGHPFLKRRGVIERPHDHADNKIRYIIPRDA